MVQAENFPSIGPMETQHKNTVEYVAVLSPVFLIIFNLTGIRNCYVPFNQVSCIV